MPRGGRTDSFGSPFDSSLALIAGCFVSAKLQYFEVVLRTVQIREQVGACRQCSAFFEECTIERYQLPLLLVVVAAVCSRVISEDVLQALASDGIIRGHGDPRTLPLLRCPFVFVP